MARAPKPLALRVHGLRTKMLAAMAALRSDCTDGEFAKVHRKWAYFRSRCGLEQTEEREGITVLRAVYATPEFKAFAVIWNARQRARQRTPEAKARKAEYDAKRYRAKLKPMRAANHASVGSHGCAEWNEVASVDSDVNVSAM
jgi:hypothetical protein